MKAFILIILMMLSPFICAQTTYQKAMTEALDNLKNADKVEDLQAVAHQFDRIAKKDAEQWEALYYSLFAQTMMSFQLPKEVALEKLSNIEENFKKLSVLTENEETLILKGLIFTAKIVKDPMTYGRTLSGEVETLYRTALEMNSENPRALSSFAQFKMGSARFWGKDPNEYCPHIKKAIVLFEQEKFEDKSEFYPRWGEVKARQVLEETCIEKMAE